MAKVDAAYCRYSSAKMSDVTIDVQLEACRKAAGGEVVPYIDSARTGRTTVRREGLSRLLADVRAGKIRRCFVLRVDRLGRCLAHSASIIQTLKDHDVELVSCSESNDALSRGLLQVLAEHYSGELADKVRRAHAYRFANDRSWRGGPPPYGYVLVERAGKTYLAVGPEAPIVQRIFEQYATTAAGYKQITSDLNADGIPARNGPWSAVQVSKMLSSSTYRGDLSWGKHQYKVVADTGVRKHVKQQPQVHHDEALRIIDEATWERVQRKLAERGNRTRPVASGKSTRPFTGLIFCGECNALFYNIKSVHQSKSYRHLRCGARHRIGNNACSNSHHVNEAVLLERVSQALWSVVGDVDGLIADVVDGVKRTMETQAKHSGSVAKELSRVNKQIADLTRLLTDPDVELAAKKSLSRQLGEMEGERDRLRQQQEAATTQAGLDVQKITAAARKALAEIRSDLGKASNVNAIIAEFVGPMKALPSGQIVPAEALNGVNDGSTPHSLTTV